MLNLIQEINNVVQHHESSILVYLKDIEDAGLHLEVSFMQIDKIIGLNEVEKIVNKHLKKYGLKVLSIGLKK